MKPAELSPTFLRAAGSESGQFDSSWWQKMTFSRIALLTPNVSGTSRLISEHLEEVLRLF